MDSHPCSPPPHTHFRIMLEQLSSEGHFPGQVLSHTGSSSSAFLTHWSLQHLGRWTCHIGLWREIQFWVKGSAARLRWLQHSCTPRLNTHMTQQPGYHVDTKTSPGTVTFIAISLIYLPPGKTGHSLRIYHCSHFSFHRLLHMCTMSSVLNFCNADIQPSKSKLSRHF